ncbi:TRPM [Cordylochernes scorpioides]|uniref:TRPM n=1 Tax=Cordylochernes scorpioides TaxID=51811 RepID=A0ABY6KNC1_9ARAC|nr:TRPM [Cordylochernes scorpioides]
MVLLIPIYSPYCHHTKEGVVQQDVSPPESPLTSHSVLHPKQSRKSQSPLNEPTETFAPNTCLAHKGKIYFFRNSTYETETGWVQGHPFVRVTHDASITSVADMMQYDWRLGRPRIVLVVISNVSPLHHWKAQTQLQQFQRGLIKVASKPLSQHDLVVEV